MLKRVWEDTKSLNTWKPKVEEHEYRDGSFHYSFRDRLYRPNDITKEEAEKIIASYGMTDVTDEMKKAGWIA